MPKRTLSPPISTTVTVMSLVMTMLSFFFLDSTNIAAYPSGRVAQFLKNLVPTPSADRPNHVVQREGLPSGAACWAKYWHFREAQSFQTPFVGQARGAGEDPLLRLGT